MIRIKRIHEALWLSKLTTSNGIHFSALFFFLNNMQIIMCANSRKKSAFSLCCENWLQSTFLRPHGLGGGGWQWSICKKNIPNRPGGIVGSKWETCTIRANVWARENGWTHLWNSRGHYVHVKLTHSSDRINRGRITLGVYIEFRARSTMT